MAVCDVDYTQIINLNINENNPFEVEPRSNWKKVGEVCRNTRSHCLIICTICVGYGVKFDHVFTTNDASAFWNHLQVQHQNFPLFNDETSPQVECYTQEHHGGSCDEVNETESNVVSAESTNPSFVVNTNGSLSPHQRVIEANNHRDQLLGEDTRHTHDTELHVDDIHIPDLDTNEPLISDYNNCNNQIVDISDDEYMPSNSLHDHVNVENDIAIELWDDEEFARAEEDEPIFNFQTSKAYKCEICGELSINQYNLNEHKKTHEDVFVNNEVPRTGFQHSHEDSDVTGSNLNDGYFQNYPCSFCSRQFLTVENLEEHQAVHISRTDHQEQNSLLPLQCKSCGKYFSSVECLSSHEQIEHKLGNDLELVKCPLCQKNVSNSNLELHISSDHKQIDYPTAEHTLLSDAMMQPMQQICANSRPFKCSICGRRTCTAATMVTHHQRFHSSKFHPNTANCKVCNKVILTKNMNLHMTSKHSCEKSRKCPHCSRIYKFRKGLLNHMTQSHCTSALPSTQVVEDSLSSSSTTTQSEYSNSQYEYHENIESFSDPLNEEDEIISYGEVIPMTVNETES